MKTCSKCKEPKPLDMFYKDKRAKDGLFSSCIDCYLNQQRLSYNDEKKAKKSAYHLAHKETVNQRHRLYFKTYYDQHKEKILIQHRAYLSELKLSNDKISRRTLAAWSMQAKRIHPYCELCLETTNLEAHHILPKSRYPQYALDLANAQVLCTVCHDDVHLEILILQQEK